MRISSKLNQLCLDRVRVQGFCFQVRVRQKKIKLSEFEFEALFCTDVVCFNILKSKVIFQTGKWLYDIRTDSHSQNVNVLVTTMAADPKVPPLIVKPTISATDVSSSNPLVVNARVRNVQRLNMLLYYCCVFYVNGFQILLGVGPFSKIANGPNACFV